MSYSDAGNRTPNGWKGATYVAVTSHRVGKVSFKSAPTKDIRFKVTDNLDCRTCVPSIKQLFKASCSAYYTIVTLQLLSAVAVVEPVAEAFVFVATILYVPLSVTVIVADVSFSMATSFLYH